MKILDEDTKKLLITGITFDFYHNDAIYVLSVIFTAINSRKLEDN